MAQPEEAVVKAVRKEYVRRGGYCFKEHGSMFSAGQPDLIGVIGGRSVVVECKAPGKLKNATALQMATLSKWRKAGALALVCDNAEWFARQLDIEGL